MRIVPLPNDLAITTTKCPAISPSQAWDEECHIAIWGVMPRLHYCGPGPNCHGWGKCNPIPITCRHNALRFEECLLPKTSPRHRSGGLLTVDPEQFNRRCSAFRGQSNYTAGTAAV